MLSAIGEPGRIRPLGPASSALTPLVAEAGAGSGAFTGGEPLQAAGRLRAGDFSVSVRHALAPFYTWVDPDRYFLAVWHATLALCAGGARAGAWLERHALTTLPLLALVVALAGGLGAGVARHSGADAASVAQWPLVGAAALALVCLLLACAADPALRRRIWLVVIIGSLALAALAAPSDLARIPALEAASLIAFFLLLAVGVERRVRNVYLLAIVISAVAIIAGALLQDGGPAGVVLALLLGGFAVKVALVPVYLWLPRMAERTPAPLVAVILAVVDVAALAELVTLRHTAGWLFQPAWPWLALGLLSAVGGAGLALAQRDIKRMLSFSSVTDTGFVVLAIALAGRFGLAGAVVAAAAGVLAKSLLFAAVAGPERDGPVTLASRGLAICHPLAAGAFIAGALTALGIPPTIGYAGHWRIYETAYDGSWVYLALLVIATALSVLAYARVIAVCWWGAPKIESSPVAGSVTSEAAPTFPTTPAGPWRSVWRTEGATLTVALVVLTIVVLAAGVWPRAW